ncbi:hypothetical protein SEPCBS119000_000438 [Sporothrix epigloea]|uniref:Uncharacterized protein n=1 Tax=Sporothrix epigloea TaxID=1892477 RepID=A0ABP0D588_9PEZI
MPTNFRTYEAQSRLLAAMLASHPSLKLNFKAIAKHYGSDSSQAAIEHRFRPIRKQASIIRQAVLEGRDAKDLAGIFTLLDKDIAKYYGESTPQGIEFQFRAIKKDAKALRDAVEQGTSPLAIRKNCPASSAASPAAQARRSRAQAGTTTPSGGARVSSVTASVTSPSLSTASRRPAKRARPDTDYAPDVENSTLASDGAEYEQPHSTQSTVFSTPSRRATHTPGAATAGGVDAHSFTTPTAAAAPTAAYFSDRTATPALSTGVSPAGNDPLDSHAVFYTALQHQRTQPLSFYQQNSRTAEDDDRTEGGRGSVRRKTGTNPFDLDYDNDDDLYIIDTPSKKPKLEPLAAPVAAASIPTAGLDLDGLEGWNSQSLSSHLPSQSQSQSPYHPFDARDSSWESMGLFSAPADPMASFAGTTSYFDNDDGI